MAEKNNEVKKSASIFEKIMMIQNKVGIARKGGTHASNKYNYSREVDIIETVKPIFNEVRVALLMSTKSFTKTEKMSRVEVEYTLVNVDKPDEKHVSVVFGEGEDKAGSVVGTPIAYTMSLKYYLAKMFIIETGDDAEIEKKKGKGETLDQKFEKAKAWIEKQKLIDTLIKYSEKLKEGSNFNEKQVQELQSLINAKVDSIQNQ